MLDDPRTKARTFLESSSIVSELEDVLNHLVYEKPDDLHGFLVSIPLVIRQSIVTLELLGESFYASKQTTTNC